MKTYLKKIIKYLFILLIVSNNLIAFSQIRPETFLDFRNPPRWQKNSNGAVIISKDGYVYNNAEFRINNLAETNVIVVYSITEDVTFYCQNYNTVPQNIPIKVKWPKESFGMDPNVVFYSNSEGYYWIIDKGVVINGRLSAEGMCLENCGNMQQYFNYISASDTRYLIKAEVKLDGSSYIQLPREELICIKKV